MKIGRLILLALKQKNINFDSHYERDLKTNLSDIYWKDDITIIVFFNMVHV